MTRNIVPSYTERAVIVGKTGSGKTTLARALLQSRPFVVIYDAKGLLRWPDYVRYVTLEECIASKLHRMIYAPRHEELADIDPTYVNRFFQWVYLRANTTLYVDEVYSVCNRGEIPRYYHACLTRGREFNISTFSSTQRPKQIPAVVLSESEHYYVFQLILPQDRQRVREIIPVTDNELRNLGDHKFLYSKADGSTIGPLRIRLTT